MCSCGPLPAREWRANSVALGRGQAELVFALYASRISTNARALAMACCAVACGLVTTAATDNHHPPRSMDGARASGPEPARQGGGVPARLRRVHQPQTRCPRLQRLLVHLGPARGPLLSPARLRGPASSRVADVIVASAWGATKPDIGTPGRIRAGSSDRLRLGLAGAVRPAWSRHRLSPAEISCAEHRRAAPAFAIHALLCNLPAIAS